MDLDAVNRELAEIVDRLIDTPVDDFATRYALQLRRDELKEAASAHRVDFDPPRPTDDLAAELTARESQLEAVISSGIDLVTQAGGGSESGGSSMSTGESGLNEMGRAAQGAPEIKSRIARLREILESRADDQP